MIHKPPHTGYLISGIYMDMLEVTHYMVHRHNDPGVSGARKLSKADVVKIIQKSGKPVYVWEWDYSVARFKIGRQVNCAVDYSGNTYLWIIPKDRATKNLRHLIKMNWFEACGSE